MVIREALKYGIEQLEGVQTAVLDTQLILCKVLEIEKLTLIISSDRGLETEQVESFKSKIQRRKEGEPTQYIIGKCEFMGLEFEVSPAVLIPRPDTETLVETVLKQLQSGNLLEIGTGSGCISCSLAHYRPEFRIDAIDISKAALETAKNNAEKLQVAERIHFLHQDIFDGIEGIYDGIISNPPYIEREIVPTLQKEVLREPIHALDGGVDGLDFYRHIIHLAPKHLKPNGHLLFEVGHNQAEKVMELMKKSGCFDRIAAQKDLAGINRVVHCQRIAKA